MLALIQVSSTKTSRAASILFWCAFQRCRLRATSGLSRSAARLVLFEAQALRVNENPHRARICLDATCSQLRRQLPYRKRARPDAMPQLVGIGTRQGSLLMAVHLAWLQLSLSTQLLPLRLEMQDGLIWSASAIERTVSPASARANARSLRSSE